MLFQGFVHPLLVWGAALAAVPLIIHLLNRQRHKPLQWAAMEFVLAAYKRTRRRAQLENLLLLLLRMAAVALLAFAIARPFTGADSALAPLTESRRDLVLVLDGSASTGYRESIESVHEAIVRRARTILEEYDGTRGDRVRLYVAGTRPQLVSARAPEDALTMLSTLDRPFDEELDLSALLAEIVDLAVEEAAGTETSAIEVRLLTDLQRGTFEPRILAGEDGEESATAPAILASLDRLDELGVRILVEDLGPGEVAPPNLGIVAVSPVGEVIGPGTTTEIGVTVRNHGSRARAGVRVALTIDGKRYSQLLDLPGRTHEEAIFQVAFREAGMHSVVASLEGDRLAVDDERVLTLAVPPAIDVLLVDGDPHPDVEKDEVGVLRAILEPFEGDGSALAATRSPFTTQVVDAALFGADTAALREHDVIVLANVGSLSERVHEAIRARVEAGTVLFVTLGDRFVDRAAIEAFNARGWRADGSGLLPAKLIRADIVPSRKDAYRRCSEFDANHPALAFFAEERWRPFLTEVPIYGFVRCEPIANARVLARLDDEARSPLLIERRYGRGTALLWTSSIDDDWNRVPESPSTLIPLVHELLRNAVHGDGSERDVPVGGTIALELDRFPRAAFVVAPDGARRALDGEPKEVMDGVFRLPAIGPLDRAGPWKVEWEGGSTPFSASFSAEEGDLERLAPDELERRHPAWRVFDPAADSASADDEGPQRGELWRWLAGAALAALVLETLWAAWLGARRRLA